jgi:UDP-N-acetylmuramoyl-tripeptide--D-alanyl-D-alanine ligase
MRNVSLKKIRGILGAPSEVDAQVLGYQIDSRKTCPGDLFFALKGGKTDGHLHLEEVGARGGVGAVVSLSYEGPDFGLQLIKVDDVVLALQRLAEALMQDCKSEIIAVTGSVGKTTTKDFIATLLEGKYKVGKTHLNYNTKLTVPITMLNRLGDEEVLVVELGMTEPGDIGRLIPLVRPDIAVLTKVAHAHKGNFERGLLDIAKYKAEIFSHLKTKKCIFDHALYEYAEAISQISSERLSFSMSDRTADYFLSPEFFVDERGVRAYQFDPLYKQPHLLHNFLAAVTVARQMKMEWDQIKNQTLQLKLPKMRFEQMEKEGILFINDAYNANPDSMKAALSSIPEPKEGGKKVAVLGMMVDMGVDHDVIHREVGRFAQKCVDHLLVIGKEASALYEAFQEVQKPAEQYYDFGSLAERVKSLARPGDVVLVKASRCVEMEKLFNLL